MRASSRSTKPSARLNCEALEDRLTPATVYALVPSTNSLISFDTANAAVVNPPLAVAGLGTGENLVGIDFRAQNGFLYGLTSNGAGSVRLYAVSQRTGVATPLTAAPVQFSNIASGNTTPVPITGTNFGFDFNPVADRIRVVTDTGFNFRMNPNTGALVDGDADATNGVQPDGAINGGGATGADGAAYTNSSPNAAFTTLYTLDSVTNRLFIQNGPNAGTQTAGQLVTLNSATLDFTAVNGFDIPSAVAVGASNAAATGQAFASLTTATGTRLYGIELSTGVATDLGAIGPGTVPYNGLAVQSEQPGTGAAGTPLIGFGQIGFFGPGEVRFFSNNPAAGTTFENLAGVTSGETLVGFDIRPQNGQLIALGVNTANQSATTPPTATLYRIDPETGANPDGTGNPSATAIATVTFAVGVQLPAPAGGGYGFDFNPTVDLIRLVTSAGQNFRLNPNTGAVTPDTAISGGTTTLDDVAYTNSYGQALGVSGPTTLYGLDSATGGLYRFSSPNGGTTVRVGAVTVGGTPITFTAVNGFDIPAGVGVGTINAPVASGFGFAALTVGTSTSLYRIDLTTGAATNLGPIGTGANALGGLTAADTPAGTVAFTGATFSAAEGGTVAVTLTRTGGSVGSFAVTVTATGGSATAGTDFTAGPYTVTFADGATTATLNIPVATDTSTEGNETFTLTLSAPTNGAVRGAPATATATITDVPPTPGTPAPGPAGFVDRLYRDVLGRTASAAEVQSYNARLAAGVPRATIATGFVNSPEGRAKAINALYQQYLDRDADQAGLLGFVNGGLGLTQVAATLVGSLEFFVRNGATNDGFVTAAYQRILGRAPDTAGRAAALAALQAGVSRTQVAQAILTSPEGAAKLVNALFTRFLGRNADPAGLAAFSTYYRSTQSVEAVIIAITSSAEYFQKTT